MTRWGAAGLSLLCGALVGAGFAPIGVSLATILGLAGVAMVMQRHPSPRPWLSGYAFGVGMAAVSVHWLYGLAWWIAVLLVLVVGAIWMTYALALKALLRLPLWPLFAAGMWILVEFITARFPLGGFAWIRLGYVGVDGLWHGLIPVVGVTGTGFVLALLGNSVAALFIGYRRTVCALTVIGLVCGGGLASLLVRPPAPRGQVNVGVVQGNVNGVDPLHPFGRARTVTNNHQAATVTLMARAQAGLDPHPDFVLWPENSTDVDPFRDAPTQRIIQRAAEFAQVPILVGAVLDGPGPDQRQTAGLWWEPDGAVTHRYIKRNLVPFGEWIPFRAQLKPLIPLLERVGAQSIPGTEPGAWPVTLSGGRTVTVGDVICFELAWDSTVRDTVAHGAQVILVQSNNASYGGSAQIRQQWQMTRARALETGRDVAVATTNSLSGVIRADGSLAWSSQEFVAEARTTTLALRDGHTLAFYTAPVIEYLGAAIGLVGLLWLAGCRRLRPHPTLPRETSQ